MDIVVVELKLDSIGQCVTGNAWEISWIRTMPQQIRYTTWKTWE